MAALQHDFRLERVGEENSRSINSMRILFLALNDVVAFEREVLQFGNNSPRDRQLHANPADPTPSAS